MLFRSIPIRITIGNKIKEQRVELKLRKEKTSLDLKFDEIIPKIKELIN